jgi:uncharacterized tellurite resistance protein B-like protein
MSVVDRALRERGTPPRESPTLSVPDALAAILVASVFVDGVLNVDESARVERVLSTSRLFSTAHVGSIERAIARLNDRGAEAVLTASARALPPELRPTAFAMAVDLVLCDGRVEPREKAYIDSLQAALGVEAETAGKIVEVLVITNRDRIVVVP